MDIVTPEQLYNLIHQSNWTRRFVEEGVFPPLKYLADEYQEYNEINDISVCLPDHTNATEIIKAFTDHVNFNSITDTATILWYRHGINEIKPWYVIGHMPKAQLYFFMDGQCCYTGFSASGTVKIYLARELMTLCKYGLTDMIRSEIKNSLIK